MSRGWVLANNVSSIPDYGEDLPSYKMRNQDNFPRNTAQKCFARGLSQVYRTLR